MCAQVGVLFSLSLSSFAQVSQPSAQPPPTANPATILDRAIEMYDAKKYPTALLAFQEAAASPAKSKAAAYLGVM